MSGILTGDCVEVMAGMEPESVDAIVTDPPYGLEFMGKEWDRLGATTDYPDDGEGPWGRTARVRYGASVTSMQDWHHAWATAALRVAKPGAYLLAFGGTRTFHRLACAIEDAGWIIRDTLVWAYAQGFPKGRANLKPAWEPILLARKPGPLRELDIEGCRIGTTKDVPASPNRETAWGEGWGFGVNEQDSTEGWNPESGRWPANVILTDPIFDGRCRHQWEHAPGLSDVNRPDVWVCAWCGSEDPPGADPIFDGDRTPGGARWEGVVGGGETGPAGTAVHRNGVTVGGFGGWAGQLPEGTADSGYGDTGTYSRFFLIPKASRGDREPLVPGTLEQGHVDNAPRKSLKRCVNCGSARLGEGGIHICRPGCPEKSLAFDDAGVTDQEGGGAGRRGRVNVHPTQAVKPVELMRHLVRLVTPQGGTVLDPFLGSGSTAIAAEQEGFAWVGIEREPEYVTIAEQRLVATQRGLGL